MKLTWNIIQCFKESPDEVAIAVTGTDSGVVIILSREKLGQDWFVTCEEATIYNREIIADCFEAAKQKAICVVVEKLHSIMARLRNMVFELSFLSLLDGRIYGKYFPWVDTKTGVLPESGQQVVVQCKDILGNNKYGVFSFYRKGDRLRDEVPLEGENMIEIMFNFATEVSERVAERTGFYSYFVGRDDIFAKHHLLESECVAWAGLSPFEGSPEIQGLD